MQKVFWSLLHYIKEIQKAYEEVSRVQLNNDDSDDVYPLDGFVSLTMMVDFDAHKALIQLGKITNFSLPYMSSEIAGHNEDIIDLSDYLSSEELKYLRAQLVMEGSVVDSGSYRYVPHFFMPSLLVDEDFSLEGIDDIREIRAAVFDDGGDFGEASFLGSDKKLVSSSKR